ncbi:MAG: RNA methyltransferase [Pseudomonadota bacterium]
MAVDDDLNARFLAASEGLGPFEARKMMGGLCYMLNGHLLCKAERTKTGDRRYMFRVGKENEAAALGRPGAAPAMHGMRKLGGLDFVDEATCDRHALRGWITMAQGFVATLDPK